MMCFYPNRDVWRFRWPIASTDFPDIPVSACAELSQNPPKAFMPSVQGLVFKIDKHLRAECGLPQYDVCRIEGGIVIGKGTLA